jgi:prepilin-type N-terminal cleavage/methylation domain-containing protein
MASLRKPTRKSKTAFTLVELLVVIAIIGILTALLLPAVQSAREAGRRTQCQNNLKQLALGCVLHESAHGHYPSGGWSFYWLGEPGRGFGRNQPGGWQYNILPFIEEVALHDLGAGGNAATIKATRGQMYGTPLSVMNCPSRRAAITYPFLLGPTFVLNAISPNKVGRGDYSINTGDAYGCEIYSGPMTYAEADSLSGWEYTDLWKGVSFPRSQIKPSHVIDGTSKTYLLGERSIDELQYETGAPGNDNSGLYKGFENDMCACTAVPPLRDVGGTSLDCRFGSAHVEIWNAAFCDGSVHAVSYEITDQAHRVLGHRADGLPIGDSGY